RAPHRPWTAAHGRRWGCRGRAAYGPRPADQRHVRGSWVDPQCFAEAEPGAVFGVAVPDHQAEFTGQGRLALDPVVVGRAEGYEVAAGPPAERRLRPQVIRRQRPEAGGDGGRAHRAGQHAATGTPAHRPHHRPRRIMLGTPPRRHRLEPGTALQRGALHWPVPNSVSWPCSRRSLTTSWNASRTASSEDSNNAKAFAIWS